MAKFQDKWSRPAKQGFMERLTDTVKPKGALKPRVEAAVKRLQAQIAKMDGMVNKLKQRDQEIFQKIVVFWRVNCDCTFFFINFYRRNSLYCSFDEKLIVFFIFLYLKYFKSTNQKS